MLDSRLLIELKQFVERHLDKPLFSSCYPSEAFIERKAYSYMVEDDLDEYVKDNMKPKFSKVLLNLIDRKGINDTDIYKKAGIDRRHFSKIRSNPDYHPGKNTAIALSLALELDRRETDQLLSAAGYSLSDSDTFDLVIQFCLSKKIYDMVDVNDALNYFSLKPLIGALE